MISLRNFRRPGGAPDMSQKGFTLLEIMAVVLIIAIFATLVVVNVDSIVPYYEMRQGAREVGDIIRRAKFYAKNYSRDMNIVYDFDNGVCWIVPAEAVFDKADPRKFALEDCSQEQ